MSAQSNNHQSLSGRHEASLSGEIQTERDWIAEFQENLNNDEYLRELRDRPEGSPHYNRRYGSEYIDLDTENTLRKGAFGGRVLDNASRMHQYEEVRFQSEEDDARLKAEQLKNQEQAEKAQRILIIGKAVSYLRAKEIEGRL